MNLIKKALLSKKMLFPRLIKIVKKVVDIIIYVITEIYNI